MTRNKLVTFILLLVTLGLLVGASLQIPSINRDRREYKLEPSNPFLEGSATGELRIPNAALTVFRSLAINYLWMRADNLKNEGQYFDALHLARMICALQPNLPTVWQFNAWNMAYNISVGLPAGPERWQWVKAGYELIRDEALMYNKTSMELYNEISWIFQHKIGGITDDDNRYYKLRLAYEMMPLLGPPTNEEVYKLAEAPRGWDWPSCAPFGVEDIIEPKGFLLALRQEGDALGDYLRESMAAKTRKELLAYNVNEAVPEELLADVVNELNRRLLDESLYTAERFAKVKLSVRSRELLKESRYDWERIPLHRQLLEDAYGAYIAPYTAYRLDQDKEVAALVEKMLRAEPKFRTRDDLFDGLIRFYSRPEEYASALLQLLEENVETPAFAKLNYFVRSRCLRKVWKIEPVWMMVLNRLYGPIDYENPARRTPLDWRQSFVHSIYWAQRGLEYAGTKQSFQELNLRRKVYHSLQDLFHYGTMRIFSFQPPELTQTEAGKEVISRQPPPEMRIFLSQDMRMFPIAYQSTLDILESRTEIGEESPAGVLAGSINLGRAGVVNYYLAGHKQLARKYFEMLKKQDVNSPQDYAVSLDEFVRLRMKEEAEQIGAKNASNYIIGLLTDAYHRYAMMDDENSTIRKVWAQQVYELFVKDFQDEQGDRLKLPEYGEINWLALQNFFFDPYIEDYAKGALLSRLEIEDAALYERVRAELEKQTPPGNNK